MRAFPQLSAQKSVASSARLAVLDGYRALAIVMVLMFHYTVRWAAPHDPVPHLPAGKVFNGLVLTEYGWLGVELFFIISGFVILMTLERCSSVGEFVFRRMARLWPPLIVAATITTIVVFLIGPVEWRVSLPNYFASVFLIDPLISGKLFHQPNPSWVDGAYWSLWVEVRFYALAAAVYLLARRKFIAAWIGLVIVVMVAEVLPRYVGFMPVLSLISYVSAAPYLPYFTLGVCIYEIYSRGSERLMAVCGAALAAGTVLFFSALGMGLFEGGSPIVCVSANMLFFVLFGLFVIDHPLVGVFKWRPVVILGQASYSLYLLHQFVGISVMRKIIDFHVPYIVALPMTLGIVIALSVILFRYVENPAKIWVMRKAKPVIVRMERRIPLLNYVLAETPSRAG
jgi:peptidoglycan/LPS O-acetylase OafA/YrhL